MCVQQVHTCIYIKHCIHNVCYIVYMYMYVHYTCHYSWMGGGLTKSLGSDPERGLQEENSSPSVSFTWTSSLSLSFSLSLIVWTEIQYVLFQSFSFNFFLLYTVVSYVQCTYIHMYMYNNYSYVCIVCSYMYIPIWIFQ